MEELSRLIRDIPDFPKEGVVFKDITLLLADPAGFRSAVEVLSNQYKGQKVDKVVSIDARGFVFGAPMALELGVGLIIVRKPGKLPYKTIEATYELEYGTDTLMMHEDAVEPGERVLIVDDVLATGGTAKATVDLVKKLGGEIIGLAFLIELTFLNGRDKISGYEIFAPLKY